VRQVLREIHPCQQIPVARAGAVGGEKHHALNGGEKQVAPPVSSPECFEHRIRFARGGVIDRIAEIQTVRAGEPACRQRRDRRICRPMRLGVQSPPGGAALQKISWFILALGCVELAGHSQTTPQPVPASDEGPAVYVVHVISAPSPQRDAFMACLSQNDLPFWRGLKEKGLLAKVSVFETTSVRSSKPEMPAWNFVISSQLAGANADSFLQAVEKRKGCENAAGVEVRRVETMRTTPNCNYARATAADDLKTRESKVEFYIEYIAVKDAPETLDRFRKFMSLYECLPANSPIRDGWWLRAVALETVKVNYSQPGVPNWNQIHISGEFPDKEDKDPAARRAANNSYRRQLNPRNDGFIADLASIPTHPRDDLAHELFDLAVR
jgi:hypothetical protein